MVNIGDSSQANFALGCQFHQGVICLGPHPQSCPRNHHGKGDALGLMPQYQPTLTCMF